jgi:hypothetical protein
LVKNAAEQPKPAAEQVLISLRAPGPRAVATGVSVVVTRFRQMRDSRRFAHHDLRKKWGQVQLFDTEMNLTPYFDAGIQAECECG